MEELLLQREFPDDPAAGRSPFERFLCQLWSWIREPLLFTGVARSSYLWWWAILTVAFSLLVASASGASLPDAMRGASFLLLLSSVPLWFLSHGLLIFLGGRWFPRREIRLVLTSRPESPSGPPPIYVAGIPAGVVALLMLVGWSGMLEPMGMICSTLAVAIGAAAVIVGAVAYATSPYWVTVPAALTIPAAVSTWGRSVALHTAEAPVPREMLLVLAPFVTLALLAHLYFRLESIRDANVRAWSELHQLLPKLATAATVGVIGSQYGPGQLEKDLRRLRTPVELVRPLCILVGSVLMLYRPWFRDVERATAEAIPGPPIELVHLEVLTPAGALRDPWRWFLPTPSPT